METVADTEHALPMSKRRMWIFVGIMVAVACVARVVFNLYLVDAVQQFAGTHVAEPSSSSSPGCSDLALVPGYFEVVQAGYTYECVPEIPDTDGFFANSDYEIAGLTDPVSKTISIVETDGVETSTQAHETGHALADIYQDSVAEAYYMAHTGLNHWDETSLDDYFNSGAESFAETYAVCSLGGTAQHIPFTSNTLLMPSGDLVEYKIGSCETLNTTLEMMKDPN